LVLKNKGTSTELKNTSLGGETGIPASP